MILRKYFGYILAQIAVLLMITASFIYLSRNDVFSERDLLARMTTYHKEFTLKKRIPVWNHVPTIDFFYQLGMLQGLARSAQVRFFQAMARHDLAYQLADTSFYTLDRFTAACFPADYIQKLLSALSTEDREMIRRFAQGLNDAILYKQKEKKLPFIIYTFRNPILSVTEEDVAGILVIQRMLVMPEWETLLMKTVFPSDSTASFFVESFRKEIWERIPYHMFYLPSIRGNQFDIMVFERNVIPSVVIPGIMKKEEKEFLALFTVGQPFPFFLSSRGITPVFRSSTVPKPILMDLAEIRGRDAKTVEFKNLQGKPLFVTEHYINDHWEWQQYQHKAFLIRLPEVSVIAGSIHETIAMMVKGFEFNEDLHRGKSSDWYPPFFHDSLITVFRTSLPNQMADDTLQSFIQLLKFENDFGSDYSILPLLWHELFNTVAFAERKPYFASTLPRLLLQHYRNGTLRAQDKNQLQKIFTHITRRYGNDPVHWSWGKHLVGTFSYFVPTVHKFSSFRRHTVKNKLSYGYRPGGFVFGSSNNEFWFNSFSSVNGEIIMISPWTDQINHPDFWDFIAGE